MKRHVILEDQERPLIWFDSEDERGWVTTADFVAFLWFLAFVGLFIAITAVGAPQ